MSSWGKSLRHDGDMTESGDPKISKPNSQDLSASLVGLDAVLFDLDGVVTRTEELHRAAWKTVFDEYLRGRCERLGEDFIPFDADRDYRDYVDGKPRLDGIRSFSAARGIALPEGTPSDGADTETVFGLGKRKNLRFHELLRTEGVVVYASSVALIRRLRSMGVRTAIVSSSRNCGAILENAGLTDLFDIKVDGVDSASLGIDGKPAPDIFLEAARRLGVPPARAAVVEDAVSGVEAGRRGGFGLVIGVARAHNAAALVDHGADIAVSDLAEVDLDGDAGVKPGPLPEATEPEWLADHIAQRLDGRRLAVFLDYDGTLTPIVDRPEDAVLSPEMRDVLRRLSKTATVAIVSGRPRNDVQGKVGLDGLYYAGNHGFEIAGPATDPVKHEEGEKFLPLIQEAEAELQEALSGVPGSLVEGKKFSVAVHYRLVADENVAAVRQAVDAALASRPDLRLTSGKKVFELLPRFDWNKGKATLWLMQALNLEPAATLPVYIGDDATDEDVFEALGTDGVCVLVSERPKPSSAQYRISDTDTVRSLLEALTSPVEPRDG